jgi:hypothetical protein
MVIDLDEPVPGRNPRQFTFCWIVGTFLGRATEVDVSRYVVLTLTGDRHARLNRGFAS